MAVELVSVSLPGTVGIIGALILAVSLVAAVMINCTDQKRKSGKSANMSEVAPTKQDAAPDTRDRCTILFGTQTGTAERFAKTLKSQLESKYGASTAFDVTDVEHYIGEEKLSKEKLVFFMMATYGDGEPTDNAAEFYNWLIAQSEAASDEAPLCKVSVCCTKTKFIKLKYTIFLRFQLYQ